MNDSENHREDDASADASTQSAGTSNAALASRYQQMFPVLSPAEIDRIRRFGEIRRFADGEFVSRAGETVPPMYVILSGRVEIVLKDALGQAVPVATVAELLGAPVEELTKIVPGEVMAELGHLSGRKDMSAIDARAVGDVEAIAVPPEALRALLVEEAERGERI